MWNLLLSPSNSFKGCGRSYFFKFLRYLPRKVVVAMLIALLAVTPLIVTLPKGVQAAASVRKNGNFGSLQPELYLVHRASGASALVASATGTLLSYAAGFVDRSMTLVRGPLVPEGLGAIKPPTFADRLSSFFALAAPKTLDVKAKETTPASQPMFLAAGSTRYDFDGDGKADVSRWHPQNAEFKVKNSSTGTYSNLYYNIVDR
jgi:hypothetical protein